MCWFVAFYNDTNMSSANLKQVPLDIHLYKHITDKHSKFRDMF